MALNRRKVLLGLGMAAAGTGAAFGSGAFTQIDADRTFVVDIENDSGGFVALDDTTSKSDATNNFNIVDSGFVENTNGTLEIRLDGTTADGTSLQASGVNRNAKTRIGDESPSADNANVAFVVRNQVSASTGAIDVSLSSTDSQVQLNFYADATDRGTGSNQTGDLLSGNSITNLTGEAGVSVVVDANDATASDVLGGTISLTATQT